MPLKNVNTKATDGGGGKRTTSQTPKATTPKTSTPRATTPRATVPKPNAPVYGSQYGGASTRNNTNNNTYGSNYGGVVGNKSNTTTPAIKKPKQITSPGTNTKETTSKGDTVQITKPYSGTSIQKSKDSLPINQPKTETTKTRADFGDDHSYENYLLENKIDTTKGDAFDYINEKARNEGVVARAYLNKMITNYKNAQDVSDVRRMADEGKLNDQWMQDINGRYNVILDENGNEVDANKYRTDMELINSTAEDINKQIEKLNKDYTSGKIDYNTMSAEYNRLRGLWDENIANGEKLNSYKTISGFDYYDWAKQNGRDVTDFESYVENFNDSLPERLAQEWVASWYDTLRTPVETIELMRTVVDPDFDFSKEETWSSQMKETADQLRSYTFGGADQAATWSLQTIGSLMPMINSMMVGNFLGLSTDPMETSGLNKIMNALPGKASALEKFTNVYLGLSSGAETARQRLAEGNDMATSITNGAIHGIISALVEGMNAGRITNILTGDPEKYLVALSLFGNPSTADILKYVGITSLQEGTEEVVETLADRFADDAQNLIFSALNGQTVNPTEVEIGQMTNDFIMGAIGAVILSTPNTVASIAGNVDTKQKYNAMLQAKAHFESTLNSSIALPGEKQLASKALEVVNYGLKNYEDNTAVPGVELPGDQVGPAPTFDMLMNNLVNAMQPDVKENILNARMTLDHAKNVRNTLEDVLARRGVETSVDEFINMDPQTRSEYLSFNGKGISASNFAKMDEETRRDVKAIQNSVGQSVDNFFTDFLDIGQNGVNIGDTNFINTDQTRTIDPDLLMDIDDDSFNKSYENFTRDSKQMFDKIGAGPSVVTSAVHEGGHFAETSGLWDKLYNLCVRDAGSERFAKLEERLGKLYGEKGDPKKEAVAFYLQKNLGNQEFLEKLATYNSSVFERIKNNLLSMVSGDTKTKIENTYMRALRDARKKMDAETIRLVRSRKSGYVGENHITPNLAMLSVGEYDRTGRGVLESYLDAHTDLSVESKKELLDRMNEIYRAMVSFQETKQFPEFSKWQDTTYSIDREGNFSVVISNGDYDMNIDFSTVCKKRKMMDKVLNQLSRSGYLQSPLTKLQMAQLREIIQNNGLEVACGLCFVDAKRFNQGSWAGKFETKWNGIIDQIVGALDIDESQVNTFDFVRGNAEASPALADIDFSDPRLSSVVEKAQGSSEEAKMIKAIMNNQDLRSYVSTNDLYGSEGFEKMKDMKPELYQLANASGGSSKPKLAHTEVLYMNEILNSPNFKPEDAMYVGGVRVQSFSDFMTNMVFDYVQMFADMEAKQMTGHSYTKVKEYALFFGKTGMKINLSIIPAGFDPNVFTAEEIKELKKNDKKAWEKLRENAGLDANGNYVFDPESFDWDLALEIQNLDGYDKNVGTICVGVSDNHIWKMLDDPNVCMIIPYHRSGINGLVAEKMGISTYNDYTLKQNTRFMGDKGRPKKIGRGFDFDFYRGSDVNGQHFAGMVENGYDAKATAQSYLDWCDANNYIPKFDTFKGHPNYYKLLIDYRAYDKNGNVAKQEPVSVSKGMTMDSVFIDPATHPKLAEIYGDDIGFNNVLQKGLEVSEATEAKQNEMLDPITKEAIEKLGLKQKGQFSLGEKPSDSDYLKAVNDNDIETAQKIVDEVAKENGYTIKAYHGTNEKFTRFNNQKAGRNFNNYLRYGTGFYFAPSAEETKRYGKNTMSVFLSANRLLDASKPVENERAYQYLVDNGYSPADAKYAMNYGDRFVNALYETLLNDYTQGGANVQVQSLLREFGYDGVADFYGANNEKGEVVVFDPTQIKSADAVTYDNNGKVIPPSQRFNKNNPDIRFSLGEGSEERADNYISPFPEDYRSFEQMPGDISRRVYELVKDDLDEDMQTYDDFLNFAEPDVLDGDLYDMVQDLLSEYATPKQDMSQEEILSNVTSDVESNGLPLKYYNRMNTFTISKGRGGDGQYYVHEFVMGNPVGHLAFNTLEEAEDYTARKLSRYGYENYSVQNSQNENVAQYSMGERTDGGDGGTVRPTVEVVDGYGEQRNQRFATSNIPKTSFFSEEQQERNRERVANGEFTYMGLINKVEVQRAKEYMERDGIDATFDSFMAVNRPDAKSVIQGEVLLQKLAQDKDPRWETVASKLADDATYAGQFLQAYAIMQRLSPEGQLVALRRSMNRMQRDLDNRFGNKAPHLEIGTELENELLSVKTEEEREAVREKIQKHLTDQVPKTFRSMVNSWRYLMMLGNPRTHIRNLAGNAINIPAVTLKNAIGTVLESAVADKLEYRTKAVLNRFDEVDQARLKLGREQYDLHKQAVEKAQGQKYESEGFSNKNAFGRLMNKLSDLNSTALDKEDYLFSRARYASSYAQFLKANNLTAENLTPEMQKRANEYALIESERATYRDANAVADWLNELSTSNKKGLRMASYVKDAIMPFTKTPMNIVKRGVRYSPVGLLYTITHDSKQLADGKITANDYIDNLSQGLTGAGIALMGALLRSLGLFRTKDDDKDRKQYFDSENGEQDYAIDLSPFGVNGTYTVDWASPVIMPFAIGAELYDVFGRLEGINGFESAINAVADVSSKVMDPIMETSMLSSLQDALKSYSTSGGEWLGEMVLSMASSYIQQMLPTLGGQIARTIDDTRRTTYTDKGKVDKTLKQIFNKIPWLSKLNEPYINRQGQEEKTEGDTWWKRAFLNMLSPGYYSSKDIDEYDEELYRLYESTASLDVFPSSGSKNITFEKERMDFTPREYTEWNKTRWQTETKYVNEFIDSDAYKNLTDEERVNAIDSIRDFAQKVAKKQFLESRGYIYTDNKELADSDDKYVYEKQLNEIDGALNNGINIYEYFAYKNDAGTKQAEKISYLEDSDLTEEQKKYLFSLGGYKSTYEEAYAKAMKGSSSKGSSSSSGKKKSSSKSHKTSSSGGSRGRNVSYGRGRVSTSRSNMASAPKQARVTNGNFLNAYSTSLGRSKNVSTGSSNQVVCPRCGNRVSNNTGRCPVCGARL